MVWLALGLLVVVSGVGILWMLWQFGPDAVAGHQQIGRYHSRGNRDWTLRW